MAYISALFCLAFLIPASYYLYIGLLVRRKDNLGTTLGRLRQTDGQKNVYTRYGKFKNYTHYVYEYSVEGKTYQFPGSKECSPGQLPKMPRIEYLKKQPKRARIQGVTFWGYLPMGGFLMVGALLFGIQFVLIL